MANKQDEVLYLKHFDWTSLDDATRHAVYELVKNGVSFLAGEYIENEQERYERLVREWNALTNAMQEVLHLKVIGASDTTTTHGIIWTVCLW